MYSFVAALVKEGGCHGFACVWLCFMVFGLCALGYLRGLGHILFLQTNRWYWGQCSPHCGVIVVFVWSLVLLDLFHGTWSGPLKRHCLVLTCYLLPFMHTLSVIGYCSECYCILDIFYTCSPSHAYSTVDTYMCLHSPWWFAVPITVSYAHCLGLLETLSSTCTLC